MMFALMRLDLFAFGHMLQTQLLSHVNTAMETVWWGWLDVAG